MKFTAFILSFQMIFAISQRSEADIGSYNPSVSSKFISFMQLEINFRIFWQIICQELGTLLWNENEDFQLKRFTEWKGRKYDRS